MSFKLKKYGFEELNKKMDDSIAWVRPNITNELVVAGAKVEDVAKRFCPVDSGRLRASIGFHKLSWNHVLVSTGLKPTSKPVNYASFVEYGTSRMAPQPYMRPAVEVAKIAGYLKGISIKFKSFWDSA